MPRFIQRFYSLFPLYTYEGDSQFISPPFYQHNTRPTLFIVPPSDPTRSLLSSDIECVKWQAYLTLRGFNVNLRWDLAAEGALDGKLPNLYIVPSTTVLENQRNGDFQTCRLRGELLESKRIPSWVSSDVAIPLGDPILEGYKDEEARNESRAWISLLEGDIHSALKAATPSPTGFSCLTSFPPPLVSEKPAPSRVISGISSIITPFGRMVLTQTILERYQEAIEALSIRLGSDKWFLGSR